MSSTYFDFSQDSGIIERKYSDILKKRFSRVEARRRMRKKYCIGLDFGTQSCRAVLVETGTGRLAAQAVKDYPHGVMNEFLPDGVTRLPMDWALQDPGDYLEVMAELIPRILGEAGVGGEEVVGIANDFTACTILPVKADGTPLCFLPEYVHNPHAYVKLWKHHAAQPEAERMMRTARERGERFPERYGGWISSEWLLPKMWQMLREAPELCRAADRIMEASDWINLMLTGEERRSCCHAGYKAFWSREEGYLSRDYLEALDPALADLAEEKLAVPVCLPGERAGALNREWAGRTGLMEKTAVGAGIIDAHAGIPGIGITEPGKLLMILGTSTCHILLGETGKEVPGICGVVKDGILPGYYAYEAGQACVGDHFEWFLENQVPADYYREAEKRGIGLHQLLTEKARRLMPGESGLLALDWWNGNRTPYADYDLSGMILGMSLTTRPEEVYRALIEATAFGANYVIETFEKAGVSIKELYACGGIVEKNAMLMQIYADVTNREIQVSASGQTPALGAAMCAAVAAGSALGGYDTLAEAARALGRVKPEPIRPIPENVERYRCLYEEYKRLCVYFAEENPVMKRLKAWKTSSKK